MPEDFLRLLGTWALLHELADDAWKAAVARGEAAESSAEGADPIDALAALAAREKDRLRAALESGELESLSGSGGEELEELRFEIGELRGRLESMEATLDAIARSLQAD